MLMGLGSRTTTRHTPAGRLPHRACDARAWDERHRNRELLDSDTYRRKYRSARRARSSAALRALDAYEQALERDATNRIAQRNIERLRLLMAAKRPAGNGKRRPEKAPATLFIEEMGKTGRARLINLASPRVLAPLSAGDAITLEVDGDDLVARVGKASVGSVEPRVAARLMKLIAGGNRYDAAIATIHEAGGEGADHDPRGVHHPANFGKVSFRHRCELARHQTVHEGLRTSLR